MESAFDVPDLSWGKSEDELLASLPKDFIERCKIEYAHNPEEYPSISDLLQGMKCYLRMTHKVMPIHLVAVMGSLVPVDILRGDSRSLASFMYRNLREELEIGRIYSL